MDGRARRIPRALAKFSGAAQNSSSMTAAPDGAKALFLANLPLIDEAIRWVCRRNRCSAEEAEDFRSMAHLRLIEDDYAVLRRHEGRSSLRSYLGVVLARLFVDHRRHEWGVWRPCAAARRLGPVAVRLDTLVNRDGCSLDQAVELLRTDEHVQLGVAELRSMAEGFPPRAKRQREDETLLEDLPASSPGAEERVLASERLSLASEARAGLEAALSELQPADRLALLLHHQQGITVARIARMLAVEQKPLYRRLEVLRKQLRQALEARGLKGPEIMDMLGALSDLAGPQPGMSDPESVHATGGSVGPPSRLPGGGGA
jgi:RNA polymerase sigma factor for flagellar operon FliA